jgi:exopolysaccharide biosynthesis WecB/TagA/CpsF family protein
MTRFRLSLGPLVVDRVSTSNALARIDGMIRHGRGGFVVNPSASQLALAERLPRLRAAYTKSSLSLASGRLLQLASLALRRPLPERFSGPDFLFALAAHAERRNYAVFLVGASERVSTTVAERLTEQFPGLRIVGQDSSVWPNPNPRQLVRKIRASGAQLVILGFESPNQEAWMLQHNEDIQPAVAFGLGSALEVVAQEARLTPRWMSRMGIGWSYSLVCEPCRAVMQYMTGGRRLLPLLVRVISMRLRGPKRSTAAVSTRNTPLSNESLDEAYASAR